MQAVKLSGVGNIPNLRRVLLVDANYVTALRPALNAILPSGALFVRDAAAVVLEIGFVPGTASWTQISAGEGYDMQLVIPCPYDYVAAAQAEQRLRGCRWLAIVEDLNGAVRLLGTMTETLRATVGYDSATRTRSFEFTGRSVYGAVFCEAGIDAVFGNSGGFNHGFSNGFRI
jgi:hypothetical protein